MAEISFHAVEPLEPEMTGAHRYRTLTRLIERLHRRFLDVIRADLARLGIDDLNEVLGNWNAGTPPASAAVPEPATLAQFGLIGAGVLGRRRA